MSFNIVLLNHFKAVRTWAMTHHGEASLDPCSFILEIKANNRRHVMRPQFIQMHNGILSYTPTLTPQVYGFIGWLPYFNKRWRLAIDKLNFKLFAKQNGLPTPEYWQQKRPDLSNVIIKQARGSFGNELRGPYRFVNPETNENFRLRPGEYFERFIEGKILKAWYWNTQPVYVEIHDYPWITGDGKSTVRDLIEARISSAPREIRPDTRTIETVLSYQGQAAGSILADQQRIFLDYRYGRSYSGYSYENANKLAAISQQPVHQQLLHCGQTLWQAIPQEIRSGVLFSVDGILTGDSKIQWLEMNCNPMFPPDAYGTMLDFLFWE